MPVTNEYFNVYSTPPINESLEQPHKVKEIDLGIRWNFTKNMGENATIFSGRHKNEIFYNPLTYANENYDKTKREGLETSLFYLITENLKFDLGCSYIEAKFDGGIFDNNTIPLVPANKFATNISYSFNDFILNLSMVCIGNRRAVSDQLNDQRKMPGFTTFDSSIIYKVDSTRNCTT